MQHLSDTQLRQIITPITGCARFTEIEKMIALAAVQAYIDGLTTGSYLDSDGVQAMLTDHWPRDAQGKLIKEGQKIAKGDAFGAAVSTQVKIQTVTKIKDGRVYLDGSSRHVIHERIAVIEG